MHLYVVYKHPNSLIHTLLDSTIKENFGKLCQQYKVQHKHRRPDTQNTFDFNPVPAPNHILLFYTSYVNSNASILRTIQNSQCFDLNLAKDILLRQVWSRLITAHLGHFVVSSNITVADGEWSSIYLNHTIYLTYKPEAGEKPDCSC